MYQCADSKCVGDWCVRNMCTRVGCVKEGCIDNCRSSGREGREIADVAASSSLSSSKFSQSDLVYDSILEQSNLISET